MGSELSERYLDSCERCSKTPALPQPVQLWAFISEYISPGKQGSIAFFKKFGNLCSGSASFFTLICLDSLSKLVAEPCVLCEFS